MASLIAGYEYDIFISYRQKDNKYDNWVSEFVSNLQKELEATIKEDISIYFDASPNDGLLETHAVDKSLEGKLKSLIFIPILSQTYCDPKSFAWRHEFLVFNRLCQQDTFGRDVKLSNGNVTSRIFPVQIHELEHEDKERFEAEIQTALRSVEFIFRAPGVNRPLYPQDNAEKNLNRNSYRDQINKVSNGVKSIVTAMKTSTSALGPRIIDFEEKVIAEPEKKASGLWEELLRRNVFRAAITYIILAWLVIQLTATVGRHMELPAWISQSVAIFFLAAFPIAMMLAWLYERSPQGLIRTSSADALINPFSPSQKKPFTNNLIIFSLSLLVVFMYFFPEGATRDQNSYGSEARDRSIAVLPFQNMSKDVEQEYFSDGVAEDILNHLVKISDLRVKSRTSTLVYKDANKTIREIGEELGVASIVEGSVRKAGNRVRIVVQLIDVKTDEHLWSESYDRELEDVFSVQSEIAKKIAGALNATLTKAEALNIDDQASTDVTAYDYFLKAREIVRSSTFYGVYEQRNFNTALQLLDKAIELDSKFAAAYALKSLNWTVIGFYGFPHKSWKDSALLYSTRAIELNPSLPDGYNARSMVLRDLRQFPAAKADLQQAYNLAPNDPTVLRSYAYDLMADRNKKGADMLIKSHELMYSKRDPQYYLLMGMAHFTARNYDKAISLTNQAKSLDPASNAPYIQLGLINRILKDYEAAFREVEAAFKVSPDNPAVIDELAWAYFLKGEFDKAEEYWGKYPEIERKLEDTTEHVPFRHRLAHVKVIKGKNEEARTLFEEQIRLDKKALRENVEGNSGGSFYYDLAVSYALLDNNAMVLNYLDSAVATGFDFRWAYTEDPAFDHLQDDQSFQKAIAKIISRREFRAEALREALNRHEASLELTRANK